jgi:hypothetical protein
MKIRPTPHYRRYHADKIAWSLVVKVIFTCKHKRVGKEYFTYISKTPKQKVYVFGKYDEKEDTFWVINAKKER